MATSSGRSHVWVGAARTSAAPGGIFRKAVGDGGWERLAKGLPDPLDVHAITLDPGDPGVVYVGATQGLFRSADCGERWERLGVPDGLEVWSVLVRPGSRTVYAGTSPVAVYRSDDGGSRFRALPRATLPERVTMSFPCRVMRLDADPSRPEHVYAAVEVGGVMRSLDGGETWDDCGKDLVELAQRPHLKSRIQSDTENEGMLDAHALCVSAAEPGTVFLAVRMGLFRSPDQGRSWHDMEVGRFSPLTYGRDIRVSPHDPRTLFACLSPAARSEDGSLYRSRDLGQTWQRFDHGVKADRTMMAMALHPRDPDQVHCVSRSGQVFGTVDGGRTWREDRLPGSVQDVYAAACG
jgi:photosystem II stability/assembly factor-like uncharacterized protein